MTRMDEDIEPLEPITGDTRQSIHLMGRLALNRVELLLCEVAEIKTRVWRELIAVALGLTALVAALIFGFVYLVMVLPQSTLIVIFGWATVVSVVVALVCLGFLMYMRRYSMWFSSTIESVKEDWNAITQQTRLMRDQEDAYEQK